MADRIGYDQLVREALRAYVPREALRRAAENGLPGAHHFFISFQTGHPGVVMADWLRQRFPHDMSIVLEHEYWGLEVEDDRFSVTLSFNNRNERLTIPFAALNAFQDPGVKFGLQFVPPPTPAAGAKAGSKTGEKAGSKADDKAALPESPAGEADKTGSVVALDAFRKK
jgi:hypothetical protein